ncbi:Hsp20/alpha crystallin family protein [Bariatricus massiliensis]|uniref:Hsp20/alpha crystallin family protein n=1 Tax=Bariatricus massiliensis TaxID=1745713 RepID=A0ABS8DHY4_9FIRM|nr:Hsp20/alpha crystallin family protein [Bariatricus massiliensis]MCB7304684.1 Hsp20/alpha crystallin family protein [Bariatricus massiliensis]MCB7374835.1 Hsp20/alpha crystallin family protein [Bariatricus massiliensis]MCB7388038.1 Hsp20/alpha crystallin family protein [Bariatricus massiliensis]MCB7412000.1 Hsp20/alpha crystallin family protein [Bariatricus massiliensis]MCQ5254209.1 Hsp20/alpha crystallin family protein [Bariatricus massiliensis]
MLMPSIFGENLFDEMMDFPFNDRFFTRRSPFGGNNRTELMKTDVRETDGVYELSIELPGFKKEDVSAKLDNGYLTINASRNEEKEEKKEQDKYIRRERYTGQCTRSFYVGEGVKQEDIQAKFEDGILRLKVPKADAKQVEQQKYIAIEG